MAIVQKVIIGSDHAGYTLKQEVIAHLKEQGLDVTDVGTDSTASCDFPVFAEALCHQIQDGTFSLGILICGTGIGMSMVANKCRGIRAACCSETYSARLTRMHNDANVLCFGARVVGSGTALDMVDAFLSTEFLGGRHQRRVDMISDVDERRP
ncbi:MAG: ribose 5-phosphate isomerase B [Clostridia bacterium]|nr:ribose 5-phosphate isomerase B [Clostridia bacterium]